MSLSRLVLVLAVAVALLPAGPSIAAAQTPAPATLELSAAGKRALKPSKLTLSSGKLTVSKATVGASATLTLKGSLRFKSGKRTVSATGLTLTIGRTSSYVSARVAKKNLRLLAVTPTRPASLDAGRGAVTLTGARIALTKPAARALRTALKLKRTPSTASLGRLSVTVAPAAGPAPAPAPITQPAASPTPAPTPVVTATPTPPPGDGGTSIDVPAGSCDPARMTATPASFTDWFGCDLPGNYDLRSWTKYVLTPAVGCSTQPGTITASDGATRLLASSAYDHRFPISDAVRAPDGRWNLYLDGTITYTMPSHAIDEQITNLELELDPGGLTGTVYAQGRTAPRGDMGCTPNLEQFGREPLMELTLTRAGGYVRASATVAAPAIRLGGGDVYRTGQPWGTFTFLDPER